MPRHTTQLLTTPMNRSCFTTALSRSAIALLLAAMPLAAAAFTAGTPGQDVDILTFRDAKDVLKRKVHAPGEKDFYCGCDIQAQGKKWVVDWQSCGLVPRKNPERASRIEWEHVVPASDFGRQRACWREGGRDNCSDTDPVFSAMEGDPYNLLPVVGEINGDRGNLPYGMLRDDEGAGYGQCGSRVDFKARVFMPRADARGDVARIYEYFGERYGLRISRQQQQLFAAWSRSDPADTRECRRAERIAAATGQVNKVLTKACNGVSRGTARLSEN